MRADDQHLPGGWCLTDIGSLGNYLNGRGFKKGEWSEDGRPIIRIQNLTGSSEKFNFFEGQVDTKHEVEPGDLLMSWAATLGAFIWRGPSAVLNQHIFKVDSFIVRSFHYYVLLWALDALYRKAHGSGMVHVTKGKFEGTPVLLPPLQEQHRIVEVLESYLTRLDDAMATLERAQRNLKRYRASVLKAAVEGRLVPTEAELARKEGRVYEPASVLLERILAERRRRWEEAELAKMKAKGKVPKNDKWKAKYVEPAAPDTSELPELPEGWCWGTIDQISLLVTDGEHLTPPRENEGIYLLSARNVRDGRISLDTVDYISKETHERLKGRLDIQEGDVLLSCSGSVGRSCTVPQGLVFSLVRSVAVIRPVFQMGEYISSALRSPFLQSQIHREKKQTAQANIFQGEIRKLVTPLPPIDEQFRLVEILNNKLSSAEHEERGINIATIRLRHLRQSILKWAFEGRLVDQDPSDEPAEVLLERIHAKRAAGHGKKQPRTRRVNTRTASA